MNIFTDVSKSIMNPLQAKLVNLGKCLKCKGQLEIVPIEECSDFMPWQCISCQTIYFLPIK